MFTFHHTSPQEFHKSLPCVPCSLITGLAWTKKRFPRSYTRESVVWIRASEWECRQEWFFFTSHLFGLNNEAVSSHTEPDNGWQMQITALCNFDYVWCSKANLFGLSVHVRHNNSLESKINLISSHREHQCRSQFVWFNSFIYSIWLVYFPVLSPPKETEQ